MNKIFSKEFYHGQIGATALGDQSVALIVKKLVKAAGLDEKNILAIVYALDQ